MKKLGYFLLLSLIFASYFVAAEIVISEPLNIYNLGDRLYVEVDGLTGSSSGNLNIDLLCNGNSTNLVKIPARAFSTEEEQSYSIPYKILNEEDLEISNISSILGECQVVTSMGSKSSATKTFAITDDIVLEAFLDKSSYDPGEQISLDISAIKRNGHKLNGFLEVSNATFFTKVIEDGNAKEVFVLPETSEAGMYTLNIYAYDVGSNGVLNNGEISTSFRINQIAASIIISLSSSEATPGEDFTFGVEVFDQSGIEMIGEVDMSIVSPDEQILEISTKVGELEDMYFESNTTAGIWKIYATFNDLIQEREFVIEEVQKANFELDGSVLIVTNIGNVLYNKSIAIQIGEEEKILELRIEFGDTRKFNLGAPKGEYDVSIDDGETSISGQVLLTGNAISINDLSSGNIFKNYIVFWIFLILVFAGIGFLLLKKRKKIKKSGPRDRSIKKKIKFKRLAFLEKIPELFHKILPKKIRKDSSEGSSLKEKPSSSLESISTQHEDKSMVDLTTRKVKEAESTLVLKGQKHISSVISISVKNLGELSDNAKESLHKIVTESQHKGLVDWRSDYIFVVFSPVITKTYHNEILASKAAVNIGKNLIDYNKRFKDKIEFNIGINAGDIVATKEGNKLKYTSIGNTVSFAKRISDSDSEKVLVSDSIRKKLLRDLKVNKAKDIGENPTFEILDIKDRKADEQKLKELMKRME